VLCKGEEMSEGDEGEMVLHVRKNICRIRKARKREASTLLPPPTHTPILNTFALLTRITNQEPKETGIQVITGGSER